MANVSKLEFPLLRLPILAIYEVLSTMGPYELINFSMLSFKCKRIVKQYSHSGCQFRIFLYILDNTAAISLKGTQMYWDYEFTSDEKEDNTIKYNEENNEPNEIMMKYSTNIVESFLNLLKYIEDLLNVKKREYFLFEMCHFPLQNDLIIQEIKSSRRPITWFELYSSDDVGNDVISIVSHLKEVKALVLVVPFSEDFEMIVPPSLSLLHLDHGQWIKLKNLLEFTASEIIVENLKLTNLEFCFFFQSWMSSESHLSLKKLEIHLENRGVFDEISQMMSHEKVDIDVVWRIHTLPAFLVVQEWFNIKRNNGTLATIFLAQRSNPDGFVLGMFVG